jgi:hypothetical protein
MRAIGQTITAGEFRESIARMDDNDQLWIDIYDESVAVSEMDEQTGDIRTGYTSDEHPQAEAHKLIEELHEFRGTKKAMLELVASYCKSHGLA